MKIYVTQYPAEAHILCGLLKQAKIPCEVRGEGMFGLRGEVPLDDNTAPYVWLFDTRLENQSREIIKDYLRPFAQSQSDWQCHHCGEMNEAQFGMCWNCGAEDNDA